MEFKNLTIKLLAYLLLLVLSVFLVAFLFYTHQPILLLFFAIIFCIVLVVNIILLFQKTQNDILFFLGCIQYNDFTSKFPAHKQKGIAFKLFTEYNKILALFQSQKTQKESKLLFHQSILQEINTGILVFNPANDVRICNLSASKILNIGNINHLNTIKNALPELYLAIMLLKPSQKTIIKLSNRDEKQAFTLSATEIIANGEILKLISIQNIQNELEENEMEAWQNMIRTLTHEIMNSLTPITSLANTVSSELKQWKKEENEEMKDLYVALDVIKNRSEGLMHFVEDFRLISKIPPANPTQILLPDFFDQFIQLFKTECKKNDIEIKINVPLSMQLVADSILLT